MAGTLFFIALSFLCASHSVRAAESVKVPMVSDHWTTTAGTVNFIDYMGKPSIELKAGNYAQHIQTGAASTQRPYLSQRNNRV